MVNPFTASTVMQSFTKKYRFQTRSYEPDGVGGFVSGWTDGPEFEAVERHDTTVEAQVAEQANTASTYTLLVNTGVPLAFPDYIKRVSDGQTFQVTSAADEGNAPPESGMGLRAVKCKKGGAAVMGPSESINRALNTFFNDFGIPGYLEDNIPPAASLPYLTYKPTIPGGWNETTSFHARLWYPSAKGRTPILQTEDKISAALADGLTVECEGGAILLRKGSPWAQPLDNPPEGYLCEYLNFELTRLIP